jgi:FixJ family two-component response regulator
MRDFSHEMTVFIVEDDASVRDALSLILSLRGYRTACFVNADDFLAACESDSVGCVLADIKMPGMSGLELQALLPKKGIELPVIIITGHGDVSAARAAFRLNAVDFLEKPFDDEQLIAGIEEAFSRERRRLGMRLHDAQRDKLVRELSTREREVFELVVSGLANRHVAERLKLSPRTIESHKTRIMNKLGVRSLAEMIRLARDG